MTEVIKWKWILITSPNRGPQLLPLLPCSAREHFIPALITWVWAKRGEGKMCCSAAGRWVWPCGDWISEALKDLRLPSAHLPELPPSGCEEEGFGPPDQIILALGALSGSQGSSGSPHNLQKQVCAWAVCNGGEAVSALAQLSVCLELVATVKNMAHCHGQPRQPPWCLTPQSPQQSLGKDGVCF